jgi:hypothetical protein
VGVSGTTEVYLGGPVTGTQIEADPSGATSVFLGGRLTYTYEITDFTPGERLVMRTAQGPFPMETT